MLEDLQIRNYAPTTVAAYIRSVAEFAKHFGKSPALLGPEQIREYQLHLIKVKGVSLSTYIQAVCALRFLYSNTLHHPHIHCVVPGGGISADNSRWIPCRKYRKSFFVPVRVHLVASSARGS